MIEKIKNTLVRKKYINFNKKIFKNYSKKSNSKILVEFNAYSSIHILSSFLSNFLSKKTNSKIVAFENYSLLSYSFSRTVKRIWA